MSLLGAAFPAHRRGWAIGVFSGLTGLAVLSGPVIGGAVTEGLAWQWIFWINVPVGVVAVPLVLRYIPESTGPARRLDPAGAVLSALAVLGLAWGDLRFAAAGLVLLLAFLAWQARAAAPMIPPVVVRSRPALAANAAGFLLTAALFGAVFFLAQFMQLVYGSGPLLAGLRLLPWTATLFLVAPVAGRLVDRVGERPLVVTGLALQAAGMFWISRVDAGTVDYADLVVPLIIAGCGVSMAMPATQSASIGALPPASVGIASGVYSTMRQLGGVTGVAVLSAVFAAAGGYGSFEHGFSRALAVCGVLSLLGACAGLGIPRRGGPAAGVADRPRVGAGEPA
jgi:MFS family permease